MIKIKFYVLKVLKYYLSPYGFLINITLSPITIGLINFSLGQNPKTFSIMLLFYLLIHSVLLLFVKPIDKKIPSIKNLNENLTKLNLELSINNEANTLNKNNTYSKFKV